VPFPPPLPLGDSGSRGGDVFPVAAVDFTFLPNEPVIKPNTTVRWTNETVTGQFHNTARVGMWDSKNMPPGSTFDFTFSSANAGFDYFYECLFHPGMEGHIKVARFGDANLDGTVNLNDFNVLAANFGQSNRVWEQGDFNEDGSVDLGDFNLLAANFGKNIEPAFGAAGGRGNGWSVPEPHCMMVYATSALPLMRRRFRGRGV
jgi:plastocyanin